MIDVPEGCSVEVCWQDVRHCKAVLTAEEYRDFESQAEASGQTIYDILCDRGEGQGYETELVPVSVEVVE